MTEQTSPESRPPLVVVKGDATPEEVAALVAVLQAAAGAAAPPPPPARPSEWSAHHRRMRVAHPHGPGAWRASALPR